MYWQRWHGWCHLKLLPSLRVLCTPFNHAPCHFTQSHICKVYACLAGSCHPCFWQIDRGLLRATAVTQGWNGYRNKSQHRKLTLEKKIIPPLWQGFEPAAFQSRVWGSNHWAIPAPETCLAYYWQFCLLNYNNNVAFEKDGEKWSGMSQGGKDIWKREFLKADKACEAISWPTPYLQYTVLDSLQGEPEFLLWQYPTCGGQLPWRNLCCGKDEFTPRAIAFWHLPPNSARFSYATEGALFISVQLSSDVVSALQKVRVLIWL